MKPSISIPKRSQINGSLSEPEIHGHSFHTISSTQHMDNSYPFHTNSGLFLQSQNRISGLSTGSPHFLHRFLLVEPISIPISGLLITKNRIYSINSNTTAHNSFWAFTAVPKVSKISTISVPCFGTDQAAHSRPFSISSMHFITKFQHKQPLTFWTVTVKKKISNKFK